MHWWFGDVDDAGERYTVLESWVGKCGVGI